VITRERGVSAAAGAGAASARRRDASSAWSREERSSSSEGLGLITPRAPVASARCQVSGPGALTTSTEMVG